MKIIHRQSQVTITLSELKVNTENQNQRYLLRCEDGYIVCYDPATQPQFEDFCIVANIRNNDDTISLTLVSPDFINATDDDLYDRFSAAFNSFNDHLDEVHTLMAKSRENKELFKSCLSN